MTGKAVDSNIKINSATAKNGVFTIDATIPAAATVKSVYLYYMTEDVMPKSSYGINWKVVTASTNNNGTITLNIPEDATYGYASIFYNNDAVMSTKLLELK